MQGLKGTEGTAGSQGRLGDAGLKVITNTVNDKSVAGLKLGEFTFTSDILDGIHQID